MDNIRRNGVRSLESMQSTLDGEIRARGEAIRIKKKIESDFNDLEIQLSHANRQTIESQKVLKILQGLENAKKWEKIHKIIKKTLNWRKNLQKLKKNKIFSYFFNFLFF